MATKSGSGWIRSPEIEQVSPSPHPYLQSIDGKKRLVPYRKTGNCSRRKLVGTDLLNLVFFLIAHPDALLEEMAIFLYNEGAAEVYSTSLISKRLKNLESLRRRHLLRLFKLYALMYSGKNTAFGILVRLLESVGLGVGCCWILMSSV